jgi:hypothetical protein
MLDLAKQIVQVCGSGVVRLVGKSDPKEGEPARYSNRKAADMLGWRPNFSLRDSLELLCKSML